MRLASVLVLVSIACLVPSCVDAPEGYDDAGSDETGSDEDDAGASFDATCHPLEQAFNCEGDCGSCPTDAGCYPTSGGAAFDCLPPGPGAFGDACTFSTECQRGSLCIPREVSPGCSIGGAGCCTWFCTVGEPTCPSGTYCAAYFYGEAPTGFEGLGACVPKG